MSIRHRVVQSASAARLTGLLEERARPGADREAIDRRIWNLFGEEWCVMVTDLAGFSRGVAEFGIIHFLQTLRASEGILVPVVESHDGILLKVEGDSFLVLFRSASKALQAAIAMQAAVREFNVGHPETEHVLLGVGLGFGRVLRIGDSDVFGVEVNAAFLLGEDTAKAWEILVTRAARESAGEVPGVEAYEPISREPPGTGGAFRVRYR